MNTYMETPRLILRDWKEEDIPVFAGLNNNDQVMEFFLKKLSYQETLDFYNRIQRIWVVCSRKERKPCVYRLCRIT